MRCKSPLSCPWVPGVSKPGVGRQAGDGATARSNQTLDNHGATHRDRYHLLSLTGRVNAMLLPMQNQENAAAIPSFLSVSPDDGEKGTLLLFVQVHARQLLGAHGTHSSVSSPFKMEI